MVDDFKPIEGLVRQYIADVRAELPIDKVYLYGSYAHGKPNKDSDVDLCFFYSVYKAEEKWDVVGKLFWLKHKYDKELLIEPNAFPTSEIDNDHPFVDEIIKTGIEL
jgi:predicted nucleotidyltransferase